jgi:hypothetical protein
MTVDEALQHVHNVPSATGDLRQIAAHLAVSSFDVRSVAQQPALINICALAWLMRERRTIHRLSGGVTRLVVDTDLRVVPSEPPLLLSRRWILPEQGYSQISSLVQSKNALIDCNPSRSIR